MMRDLLIEYLVENLDPDEILDFLGLSSTQLCAAVLLYDEQLFEDNAWKLDGELDGCDEE